jgi:integrase
MIVVGTFLFLRANELLALNLEDFKAEGVKINGNTVKSLCVVIKDGKADIRPIHLKLWRIDDLPWKM